MRGRILGDQLSKKFMTDLRLNPTCESVCYFRNFHHALRENPRIDTILKMPSCTVLRVKFFADKKRVVISLSNGIMVIYNTADYQIVKLFVSKYAIIDSMKLIEDKYLITAGIDPKVRIWSIENDKVISKFQIH
jgi:WD40 repeat protein